VRLIMLRSIMAVMLPAIVSMIVRCSASRPTMLEVGAVSLISLSGGTIDGDGGETDRGPSRCRTIIIGKVRSIVPCIRCCASVVPAALQVAVPAVAAAPDILPSTSSLPLAFGGCSSDIPAISGDDYCSVLMSNYLAGVEEALVRLPLGRHRRVPLRLQRLGQDCHRRLLQEPLHSLCLERLQHCVAVA